MQDGGEGDQIGYVWRDAWYVLDQPLTGRFLLACADDVFWVPAGTKEEGAKLVEAWIRLGFRTETQVAPDGGARRDTEPWQQILILPLD